MMFIIRCALLSLLAIWLARQQIILQPSLIIRDFVSRQTQNIPAAKRFYSSKAAKRIPRVIILAIINFIRVLSRVCSYPIRRAAARCSLLFFPKCDSLVDVLRKFSTNMRRKLVNVKLESAAHKLLIWVHNFHDPFEVFWVEASDPLPEASLLFLRQGSSIRHRLAHF